MISWILECNLSEFILKRSLVIAEQSAPCLEILEILKQQSSAAHEAGMSKVNSASGAFVTEQRLILTESFILLAVHDPGVLL